MVKGNLEIAEIAKKLGQDVNATSLGQLPVQPRVQLQSRDHDMADVVPNQTAALENGVDQASQQHYDSELKKYAGGKKPGRAPKN